MKESSIRLELFAPDTRTPAELPMAASGVAAGFPSPADDAPAHSLDLNRLVVRNPSSTFFVRVAGDSMRDAGIDDGDLLAVDKSLEAEDGTIAVCFLDGEFTLKRVRIERGRLLLVPANARYRPIEVSPEEEFAVWGVVTYVIKKLR